jgi:HD-GYP domain-containing protein (c-di-GMP phosphodiesterase class II)
MRRITLKYVKPGMVVEAPVYDNWGNELVYMNEELTHEIIGNIIAKGVSEIFIRDWRVSDVVVVPLFSPKNEGMLAKAFRQLILDMQSWQDFSNETFTEIQVAFSNMVKDMGLNVVGDLNVMCTISPTDYVYLQPVKTAGLCLAIGRAIGLKDEQLTNLGMAAVFKDIGLSPEMMASVDYLTEGASPRLKDHPVTGPELLQRKNLINAEVATAIMQHHETWNGGGYPQGLKGKEISLFARIIAISDAFIDLLSARPGRNKYMPHEAIEYIMAFGGDQFDPELVEKFVRMIPSYPTGLSVQLNTGDTGIVSDAKLGFVARPIVRICYRPVKGLLTKPIDIDLSHVTYQRLLITKVLEYD